MKILQKGFNYSQDGPGNRLVYHLQGCNFKCKWCSNADSIPAENPKAKDVDIRDLADEVLRSRMMFFDGGGVTFTGGEATLQADELTELLRLLRAEGIDTCIETNGSSPRLIEIAELTDHLIVDFKLADERSHMYWCGASNRTVKANIRALISSGRRILVRIPLIHGVNDASPEAFAEFFSGLDTSGVEFEFLAYHEYGKGKWRGRYEISDGFLPPGTKERFENTFRSLNYKVIST
ncbi:MAG: radical SAM protein [Clostridia bacterium]|nr:radical SAM protein [Clostridia bacterium]